MSQLNKLNLNLDKHGFPGGNMYKNIYFVCVCVFARACVFLCVFAMSRLGVKLSV